MRKSQRAKGLEKAAKEAMSKPLPSGGPARLVFRDRLDGTWTWEIEGGRNLADRIGRGLFAAFLRTFQGVDRLVALEHLTEFNAKLATGETAQGYNEWLLTRLIASTMYETADALMELRDAGVADKVSDSTKWDELDRLRGKWQSEKFARVRNSHGFHLGYLYEYELGLSKVLNRKDAFVLVRGDGRAPDGQNQRGIDTVFSSFVFFEGIGQTMNEVAEIVAETEHARSTVPGLVSALFVDVLMKEGVPTLQLNEVAPATPTEVPK